MQPEYNLGCGSTLHRNPGEASPRPSFSKLRWKIAHRLERKAVPTWSQSGDTPSFSSHPAPWRWLGPSLSPPDLQKLQDNVRLTLLQGGGLQLPWTVRITWERVGTSPAGERRFVYAAIVNHTTPNTPPSAYWNHTDPPRSRACGASAPRLLHKSSFRPEAFSLSFPPPAPRNSRLQFRSPPAGHNFYPP
ncbi:uncharacterized protein EI97DRAFT_108311 [Westerdykella ornata]|uniref:Uncharacterized protein n=1 Tax=Westerdykella ornata TaxID=318751 RepID=A0A6A6JWB3_WESOR|nr:uncharacterized protein EI97DRAFT_108311 [Westerdykella ornata]KAF2280026.1 hypothetical protein EI97DRAFT_108311 [Westerdykella ornata]